LKKGAICGKLRTCVQEWNIRVGQLGRKGYQIMAKCQICGKTTTFGHNRSFSMRATNRTFKPNLQKVSVLEKGRKARKLLCTKCIRTLVKTK